MLEFSSFMRHMILGASGSFFRSFFASQPVFLLIKALSASFMDEECSSVDEGCSSVDEERSSVSEECSSVNEGRKEE